MGAMFSNVQVHRGGREAGLALTRLTEGLSEIMTEWGYVAAGEHESADRTLLLDAGDDQWLTVYDEAIDNQSSEPLEQLANALSKKLDAHALSVLVHDSDVLVLGLHQAGALSDSYNSHPTYFGKISAAEKRATAGKPEKWRAVLAANVEPAALKALWTRTKQDRPLFAEDTLGAIAELLGLDEARARVGYRYALQQPERSYRTLRFQQRVRLEPHTLPRFAARGAASLLALDRGLPSLPLRCAEYRRTASRIARRGLG